MIDDYVVNGVINSSNEYTELYFTNAWFKKSIDFIKNENSEDGVVDCIAKLSSTIQQLQQDLTNEKLNKYNRVYIQK